MTEKLTSFFKHGKWEKWVIPIITIAAFITCLQLLHGNSNNFTIFRYSSVHLLAHQPLYIAYPDQYIDYFLYNPSFTVLFMPFSLLPAPVALCLWTGLSLFVYLRAVHLLPGISNTAKKIMLLLVLPELVNNLQYAQTNIFLVSLMLLAFIYFERGFLLWAAFFAVAAFCIKGFGSLAGLLFVLYPGKLKFILYAVIWVILISSLPLLFVSFNETITHYADWLTMISSDGIKESQSIVGLFGKTHQAELLITIAGLLMLITSLAITLKQSLTANTFYLRGLLCCYLFLWMVLFNRAAESPTYQIAITGLALWFALDGFKKINIYIISILFLSVYILPSDLFPAIFHQLFRQYQLKVYPFIFFLFYLQYQLAVNAKKALPKQ